MGNGEEHLNDDVGYQAIKGHRMCDEMEENEWNEIVHVAAVLCSIGCVVGEAFLHGRESS